jgi:hypothetical protein
MHTHTARLPTCSVVVGISAAAEALDNRAPSRLIWAAIRSPAWPPVLRPNGMIWVPLGNLGPAAMRPDMHAESDGPSLIGCRHDHDQRTSEGHHPDVRL